MRNLAYYRKCDKIYWFPVEPVGSIPANRPVPCIFVEKNPHGLSVIDFDHSIENDNLRYTAWRSFLGKMYGARIDVLLIDKAGLITLDNRKVDFDSLGRSKIYVSREHIAPFSIKNEKLLKLKINSRT